MNPLSLLTNLAINDIVGSIADHPTLDLQHDIRSLQLIVLDEALGEAVKNALSEFEFSFKKVQLKGISVLKKGSSVADIIPIVKSNLTHQIHTVVIGGPPSTFKACFDTFQFREKFFNAAIVQPSAGKNLDKTILEVKRPWMQGLFLLANQAHLSDPAYLIKSESEGLRSIRLGAVRNEPGCLEPEIRSADLFGLSINALRFSDANIQSNVSSTGLTAEEACQMVYYAGRSDRNKVTVIFDFLPSVSTNLHGVNLLSTLFWYFLHGLNFRATSYQNKISGMKKFTLEHGVHDLILTFYKDEAEQKWWLECPFKQYVLSQEMPYIACDYQDYRMAANEQTLTERLNSWFQLYESSGLLKDRF